MSERSEAVPTPEGEYFESEPVRRLVGPARRWSRLVALVLSRRWRLYRTGTIRFLLALWLCLFLHALRRLFLLDRSCITPPMRNGRSSFAGNWRMSPCSLPVMALFFIPILLLRHHLYGWMNDPAGQRSRARFQARLSELAIFPRPRASSLLSFSLSRRCCSAAFPFGRIKDGNPRYTLKMRRLAFVSLPLFAPLPDLRRLRLAA